METFKASRKAAELVLSSRENSPTLPPQLNFTSDRAVPFDKAPSLDLVQEAIGERLVRLLGTVARQRATRKPALDRVVIISGKRTFVPDVEIGLTRRLGLSSSKKQSVREALRRLAIEFHDWARDNPAGRSELGLEFDNQTNDLLIQCPDLRPVVGPIKD
jgi:hypothetical protein